MQKAKLYTKYKFIEQELVTVMKLTGTSSSYEAEAYIDKLDDKKRDALFIAILFFMERNDKIKGKIFNNPSGL